MPRANSPPALVTLYLLAATSPLTLNMIVPSLANITADLKADYAVISLALGGYLALTALVELVVGPLADRVGRRPVLLAALAVFTVASLGCAMSESAYVFLAFRMLQAGVVSGFVLSLAIARDVTEGPEVAGLLGKISMAMAIAPMLGPMLGSALDTAFGWRSIFLLYFLLGGGLLCLTWFDLGETIPRRQEGDRSGPPRLSMLLREPVYWCYAFCTIFSTGAFYIFLAGAPLIASLVFGISTAELGVYVGSIIAGFVAGSFLASRLAKHSTPVTVMLAGRLVACVGLSIGLALIASGVMTPMFVFGSTVFVGLGNGLTMPNSNAGVMSVLPRLAGSAAGITGALTLAGGALMTTVTSLALTNDPSPAALLVMMLLASLAGLVAAIGARALEQRKVLEASG